MIPKSKVELTVYNENFQVEQTAHCSIAYGLIEDLKDYHGEEVAKEAWWKVYLELKRQLKNDGL